ncbi:MAG: CBS domain-containing protein [bacterium]
MGEQNVNEATDSQEMRTFMRALLEDVRVLENMLNTDLFERDIRRIGAEQEVFLVDKAGKPILTATEILKDLDAPQFTHELALFNLEVNMDPQLLGGHCLSTLEKDLNIELDAMREKAKLEQTNIALTGTLPTLKKSNLGLDSMVPIPRYRALNDTLLKMRGSDFQLKIKGVDELDVTHDNLMLEACNTSFQVHFQVAPEEFAKLYNMAQVVTAPLVAVSANSPLLLGKRLWHETRIAVFEHSIDTRSEALAERGQQARVHFGNSWVDNSVVEIFKEDIARFRVVLTTSENEDPEQLMENGIPPQFYALRLHNGTVYRWNRACYGVADGIAHLRIENRVIPSGPTVIDEVANAAFFYGMLSGLSHEIDDVREHIQFDDVKNSFFAAAREGLRAQVDWLDDVHLPVTELILEHLLPLARRGLGYVNLADEDINRYLNVIEARVLSRQTGAQWTLDSIKNMRGKVNDDEINRQLVSTMVELSKKGKPVHTWPLAEVCAKQDWRDSYRKVGDFMTTDLFTVHPDDLIDFAASLMEWKHIRHVPVEDNAGELVGLVSHRALLRIVARGKKGVGEPVPVQQIMRSDPIVVSPETMTVDAIRLMREQKLGCLPVVRNKKLIGILTERDLINVAGKVLEGALSEEN